MRSIPEFLLIAVVVTMTPGPVTALVLRVASQVAYDVLRIAGACVLVYLGARSLLRRGRHDEPVTATRGRIGTLIWAVDRASTVLRPRVRRTMERVTGGVMVALGVGLAAEAAR